MAIHLSVVPLYSQPLSNLPSKKLLINTINAHCYNLSQKDAEYAEALAKSDVLLPDGVSVVWANRWLKGKKIKKIAGEDLFFYEMDRLEQIRGKCFFLGSTESTLTIIRERTKKAYPHVQIKTFSPPYKLEFSSQENAEMLEVINAFQPDVLFVGMTAPKQEKWAYLNYDRLQVGHVCCIGAVFDFYAGTVARAPRWMISIGIEWLYRFLREPRRMWKRYLLGNAKFIYSMIIEKRQQ